MFSLKWNIFQRFLFLRLFLPFFLPQSQARENARRAEPPLPGVSATPVSGRLSYSPCPRPYLNSRGCKCQSPSEGHQGRVLAFLMTTRAEACLEFFLCRPLSSWAHLALFILGCMFLHLSIQIRGKCVCLGGGVMFIFCHLCSWLKATDK